ncbi:MAG: ZIP family metal transporter [Nitrospinae bacterium]|nr:ZIP family metal transporter [Nitrospinota bacterium]
MTGYLVSAHPAIQALAASMFTWGLTALGAASVFLHREPSRKTLDVMLGFAGGIMVAACFWSLLAPAIRMAHDWPVPAWFPAATGFVLGAGFLNMVDRFLPHLHLGLPMESSEGVKTKWRRATLLTLSITLHNIPEGLAVGVAFGAAAHGLPEASFAGAVALAFGIGIQNLPEGAAVSIPLRREGLSPSRSFWYGQLSGMVEPLAAVTGAAVFFLSLPFLPYALAFAAGAMIYVVAEEVIPESQQGGNADQATMGFVAGFTLMMILDVASG